MSATTEPKSTAHGVVWDLSALFSGLEDPKIAQTWEIANKRADAFAQKYRGSVASLSASELAEAIAELESLSNEAAKPSVYAGLRFAADTSDPKLGAFYQAQSENASALRVKLMFFDLELQKMEEETVERLLADEALRNYRHHIRVVRAYSRFQLDEPREVLLEETANTGIRAWQRLHDEVTSNHKFPYKDPHTGEATELSQEEAIDKLRESDRAVRIAAGDAISAGLQELERVIVFTYNTILADRKLEDRLRGLEYPEHSRHLANELDKETVDLVMRLCRERSDVVERYYAIKQEILSLEELTHVDRYAPLFDSKEEISWNDAHRIVIDGFRKFHPKLAEAADEFFTKRWIDAEPRPGKTGGAFCSYNTPDTHPVMLMTYLGKLSDVTTLAHELGHCAHASLSRVQTPFNYHGTLPLAELASIFGEILVFEDLVADASNDEALALYAEKCEGIFASVHRQSAMFRFEQKCHNHRREHGELSPETFGEFWQEEIQSMFGNSIALGEQHRLWWLYVGHFFFAPFYVYAYSFGELLTLSLYQRAKSEGPAFADKYIDVLTRGGSETPHELMARLGVDIRSEEFWQGGFEVIDQMVEEFERRWNQHKQEKQ